MKIVVNDNFHLERSLSNESAAASILVEIVTHNDGKPVTSSGCAEFIIYTNDPEHNAFLENSNRLHRWNGTRLPAVVEREMEEAIRDAFEISFAEVKKIFEAKGDHGFEMHVGKIIFPRTGNYIPKEVALGEDVRIVMMDALEFTGDVIRQIAEDNYLVIYNQKFRDGVATYNPKEEMKHDDERLELVSRTFVTFKFQVLRVLEGGSAWVDCDALDGKVIPELPELSKKFMTAFFDSSVASFEEPALPVGGFYCSPVINLHVSA